MLRSERPRPAIIRNHRYAPWFAVGTVCLGAFMGQLDASIVTLTFPALERQFEAPLAAIQWVSLSYLLTLVGLVAAGGRLADSMGRKRLYLYGFVIFSTASAGCALAPDLEWLIGFRVLQAAGAALLQANSVALVVGSVSGSSVRDALGIQAAAQALGLALGPTLGGIFVDSFGWEWVFWVNVPVGVLGLVAGHYLLPRTVDRTPVGRFDALGLLLLAAATTSLLTALSGFSGLPLPDWTLAGLLGVAVLATAGFVRRERRVAAPLVDLALLRPPVVSLGLLGALAAYMALFAPLVLVPQVLIGEGSGGTHAGFVLSGLPVGFAVAALGATQVLRMPSDSRVLGVGGAVLSIGAVALLLVFPFEPWWIAPPLFLLGLGLGAFLPSNNAAVMVGIPARASAVAGGILNMSRGLGTALGVAVVTLSLSVGGASRGDVGTKLALAAVGLAAAVAGGTAMHSRSSGHVDGAEAPDVL